MPEYKGLRKSISYAKNLPRGCYVEWFARKTKRGYEIDTSGMLQSGAIYPNILRGWDGWECITDAMSEYAMKVDWDESRDTTYTERVKAACKEEFE